MAFTTTETRSELSSSDSIAPSAMDSRRDFCEDFGGEGLSVESRDLRAFGFLSSWVEPIVSRREEEETIFVALLALLSLLLLLFPPAFNFSAVRGEVKNRDTQVLESACLE